MSDDTAQAAGEGMSTADVPDELVEVAADRIHAFYAANPDNESEEDAIRELIAAVLPMIERETAAEVEQLRARLAEIGETEVEWGVRGTSGIGDKAWVGYAICETEERARAALAQYRAVDRNERNPIERTLVKRLAGQWREVPDA